MFLHVGALLLQVGALLLQLGGFFLQVSAIFSRFFVAGCFACASDSFELVYWGTDFSVGV